MQNELQHTIVEIVDLNTGELYYESRLTRHLFSYGLQGLDKCFAVYYKLLRSGIDCTINISAFSLDTDIKQAEFKFIESKLPF